MSHNLAEKTPVSKHREATDCLNDEGDCIDDAAVGGTLDDLPRGYYTNWRFIGSLAAVSFMAQGLYLGMS